ncbi:MAG TPA: PASTA domain-containing protein [Solirubrobacterales bacterium]|nr:PASTA domain-containing protein [Solirubrobacterales bacterium]
MSGTIVRWHVLDASGGEFRLRTLRPAGGGGYTAVGSSAFELPASEALQTFGVDLPIQVGDLVGLDNSGTEAKIGVFDDPDSRATAWKPQVAEGGTTMSPFEAPAEIAFDAEVETPPSAPAPIVNAHCVVPRLKGKKLKAAKRKLKAARCKVGKVTIKKGVTARSGKVIKQGAKPGRVLAVGTKVKLVLGH